jgi:hypothetical protein
VREGGRRTRYPARIGPTNPARRLTSIDVYKGDPPMTAVVNESIRNGVDTNGVPVTVEVAAE